MTDILSVENLSKSYKQGTNEVHVLNGLSLNVKKGSTVAILGQSGSGKSTFLSLLSGLDKADQGKIQIAGSDITTLDEKALAKFRGENLGIIFQQFHLMNHMTALENTALPLEISKSKNTKSLAKNALEKVGLGHRVDHYPNELSGGENQRVAIARAFIVSPKLLIADEPSGNLDQETGDAVMEILFDLVKKNEMTLVLVTHNRELAQKCEAIYKLNHGKLERI